MTSKKTPRQRLAAYPRAGASQVWNSNDLQGAKQERARLADEARAILDRCKADGRRDLTTDEAREFNETLDRADELGEWIEEQEAERERLRAEPLGSSGDRNGPDRTSGVAREGWVRTADLRPAVVDAGQRFADHHVAQAHMQARAIADRHVVEAHGDIGNLVRAITTSSGSAVVPTEWVGDIIDRARNLAAVLRAGAQIVPMDAKTVQIGRLTGDPTAAFRAEGSLITASDPTFDNVTLDAKTMNALVVGSIEWFQDSINSREVVAQAIAQAIALQLDLVSLYGSITAGAGTVNLPTPPNPRGVLGALNAVLPANVLGGAANGTTQTAASYWNEVLDTIFTVRDRNEEPTALIWNSKLSRQYAKAYDTTGQPLAIPAEVERLQRYTTNQVPSYTQGTMANRATDLFAGDWAQLLIGQRLDLMVQALTERYAENGQIGILATWRGDVQLARPGAFAVYKALQGA